MTHCVGDLIKSRAALNVNRYNRLTGESGSASNKLEFPDGGIAYVIGHLIQQSVQTENPAMVSFGAEGYRWPANEIYLVATLSSMASPTMACSCARSLARSASSR